MSNYTFHQCPNCASYWSFDEIQSGQCYACGYRDDEEEELQEIEFHFVNSADKVVVYDNLSEADLMVATFRCECGAFVSFNKPYAPVPLHTESLLIKCADVTCKKCGAVYEHIQEEGLDFAKLKSTAIRETSLKRYEEVVKAVVILILVCVACAIIIFFFIGYHKLQIS